MCGKPIDNGAARAYNCSVLPRSQPGILLQRNAASGIGGALLCGMASALLLLLVRLALPFDGLYGQDAYAYFRHSRSLWSLLLQGEPPPIFLWPSGYPLIVALALPLAGWGSAAGQLVSGAALALAAACTFLLARDLSPGGERVAAWTGGLAVALSGAAPRAGLTVMSDATALGCCAAAMWAAVRYARTRRGAWLVAAALALSWATITRWVCALLLVPIGLLLIFALRSIPPGGAVRPRAGGAAWQAPLAAATVALLVVVPQLLVSVQTPTALSRHAWVQSWDLGNIWRREFTTIDGTQHYALPMGLYNLLRLGWPSFLAPPLSLAAPLGALWLWREHRWGALALLVSWPALLWLFLSGVPFQNPRFGLPALPALAALAGIGAGWFWTDLSHRRTPVPEARLVQAGLRRAALGLVAAGMVAGLALGLRDYRRLVISKGEALALIAWTDQRLPDGATLVTFGPTLSFQHYSDADVRELFYLTPAELRALGGREPPAYLLLDTTNAETQWAGLWPEQAYLQLRREGSLSYVDRSGAYTLFQLRSPAAP